KRARVKIGLLHIAEVWGDDDAGGVVLRSLASRQNGKIRQFGKRDIHAKRAGPATPVCDPPAKILRQGAGIDEMKVEELGINSGGDGIGADQFAFVRLAANEAKRPSRMSSIHLRALAMAMSKASRLSGFIVGFSLGS